MIDQIDRPYGGRFPGGRRGGDGDGTTSPTRDPHVAAAALRRHGLRATSARIALILGLGELGHATPEQLHTTLAPTHPGLNVSTVYRTLESLTDLGLVAHAHLTGSAPSYHLTDGTEHAHLVRQDCGTITPLRGHPLQQFAAELATDPGFTVTISHLTVHGQCHPCQTRHDEPDPTTCSGGGPHDRVHCSARVRCRRRGDARESRARGARCDVGRRPPAG